MYDSKILQDFGRNLFIVRKALKINHEDLVELTGITRPILSGIENSSANPRMSTIIILEQSLNLSRDLMFLSKTKFVQLQKMFKPFYDKNKNDDFDLHIDEKSWKKLLRYSGCEEKRNINIVSKLIGEIIRTNFQHHEEKYLPNMMLGSSLGVIFLEDGFRTGLEFGAWLGYNLR